MRDRGEPPISGPTLYQALGAPVSPAAATHGETAITAAKETLDRDAEDDLAALLLDRA
jgi:hypothetical protein